MGDYDIVTTINAAPCKGLFALLRPPDGTVDPNQFMSDNRRIIDVLDAKGGVPILLDINEFFQKLCSALFAHECAGHSVPDSAVVTGMPPILEDQLQPWASAISPVEATQFLALLCHHLGDGQLSRQLYDIVLRDAPMDAGLRLGRAYAFAREGKHDHAFREADRVLHLPASERTHFQTAEALFHSGEALRARSRGRSLRALFRLRSAVQLYATCSGTQASHGQGSALLSLALVYRSFVPAWPVLRPVRRWILQQLRDAYALLDGPNGNALCLIAELQLDLGEIEQARATADHAAMICRWHDDHVGLANTNRALARIYLAAGDREKADDAYHAAYCESQFGHDVPGRMKAARALAGIARARGDRERGRQYLRVTWICARRLGVRNAGWRAYIDTAWRVGCLDVRDRLSCLRWMA